MKNSNNNKIRLGSDDIVHVCKKQRHQHRCGAFLNGGDHIFRIDEEKKFNMIINACGRLFPDCSKIVKVSDSNGAILIDVDKFDGCHFFSLRYDLVFELWDLKICDDFFRSQKGSEHKVIVGLLGDLPTRKCHQALKYLEKLPNLLSTDSRSNEDTDDLAISLQPHAQELIVFENDCTRRMSLDNRFIHDSMSSTVIAMQKSNHSTLSSQSMFNSSDSLSKPSIYHLAMPICSRSVLSCLVNGSIEACRIYHDETGSEKTLDIMEYLHDFCSSKFIQLLLHESTIEKLQNLEQSRWPNNQIDMIAFLCVDCFSTADSCKTLSEDNIFKVVSMFRKDQVLLALKNLKKIDVNTHIKISQAILRLIDNNLEEVERVIRDGLISEKEKNRQMHIMYARGIANIERDLDHGIYCAKQLLFINDLRFGRCLYDIINFIHQCVPEKVPMEIRESLFLRLFNEVNEENDVKKKELSHYMLSFIGNHFSPVSDEGVQQTIDLMYSGEDADIKIMRFLYQDFSPQTGQFIWVDKKLDLLNPVLRKDIVLATELLSTMWLSPKYYCEVQSDIGYDANEEVRIQLINCLSKILGRDNPAILDAQRSMDAKYPQAGIYSLVL